MKDYWKRKLTTFDLQLCSMLGSLTGAPCEPKNGGDHYFLEADYSRDADPDRILAIWDAVEGRLGDRLMSISDDPDRRAMMIRVRFREGSCREEDFVPRKEEVDE